MHYKCYLYTKSPVTHSEIEDILKPFREETFNEGLPESEQPKFLYDTFLIGGDFRPYGGGEEFWNGTSIKVRELEKRYTLKGMIFNPADCFIVMDDSGDVNVRDEYEIRITDCTRPDFYKVANEYLTKHWYHYITLLDIHI